MKPKSGVLENVVGLAHTDASSQSKSPLLVVEEELAAMGYDSTTVRINLSTFHCVVRQRFSSMHQEDP
eukprot:1160668-Amphidinium_carterae.1